MKRILAIGNSFSQDATRYLHAIAASAGMELEVVNLYIGGCSLERHSINIATNETPYLREDNGVSTETYVTIPDMLQAGPWDIVTIQQVSHCSGQPETYEPYGTQVLDCIRKYAPDAQVWFHQTWAYDPDSSHSQYPKYDCCQQQMYGSIRAAVAAFALYHKLDGIIPVGQTVQELRGTRQFDPAYGGESLCRDKFHLSHTYGRYTAAAVWFETLLGGDIRQASFVPTAQMLPASFPNDPPFAADPEKLAVIRACVHRICSKAE